MKFFSPLLCLASLFLASNSFGQAEDRYTIIPRPTQITPRPGEFLINRQTALVVPADRPDLKLLADELATDLNRVTQLGLTVHTELYRPATSPGDMLKPVGNVIRFLPVVGDELGDEGYRLDVTPTSLTLEAAGQAGFFYAIQSLIQLLPPALLEKTHQPALRLSIPAGHINDRPRYAWRGMQLDVSRHFFPVSFLKKHLDLMALHKLNVFHWHLTDDQGWRIEIKKYPKLTQIGSHRPNTIMGHFDEYDPQIFDDKPISGFYTQDDIQEVVRYAQKRHITIVPEIELPGHALAALAAYPEYGCANFPKGQNPYSVAMKWGVFDDVYCPYEKTFTFLQDVLTEVMGLFPSKFIHIGGDECPRERWEQSPFCHQLMKQLGMKHENEIQAYFVRRIDTFLTANGRRLMGWDEILQGKLPSTVAVMSWRSIESGVVAARQQHDVVMTPERFCYFNFFQSEPGQEPLAFGGYLPLATVYAYDPTPNGLTAEQSHHILGAQANLWTEYISSGEGVEYQLWPRVAAFAEVVWTDKPRRDYADFSRRLPTEFERLRLLGVNFASSFYDVTMTGKPTGNGQVEVSLSADKMVQQIHYTIDGGTPTAESPMYAGPIVLSHTAIVRAAPFGNGRMLSRVTRKEYLVSKATGKPYTLLNAPLSTRPDRAALLTNGVTATIGGYELTEMVAFKNTDLNVVIDLGTVQAVSKVTVGVLKYTAQAYCLPRRVAVSVSDDGLLFRAVGSLQTNTTGGRRQIERLSVGFVPTHARFVRVLAQPLPTVPAGLRKTGKVAQLGVDEISVE